MWVKEKYVVEGDRNYEGIVKRENDLVWVW